MPLPSGSKISDENYAAILIAFLLQVRSYFSSADFKIYFLTSSNFQKFNYDASVHGTLGGGVVFELHSGS